MDGTFPREREIVVTQGSSSSTVQKLRHFKWNGAEEQQHVWMDGKKKGTKKERSETH